MTEAMDVAQRRSPWVTMTIIAAYVAMFMVIWATSASRSLNLSAPDAIKWGGNIAYWTWDGQWWRLFSTKFIHLNVLSLAMVAWAFWDAGRVVERIYGGLALLVIFLGASVVTSLGSLTFSPVDKVVVGGGGTTFAIFGATIAYAAAARSAEILPLLRPLRFSAPAFALWIAYGLHGKATDLPSVSIGLLSGFMLGLCFAPLGDVPGGGRARPLQWPLAILVAGILSGAIATQAKRPPYLASEAERLAAALRGVQQEINALLQRYEEWDTRIRAGGPPYERFAEELEREHVMQWRTLRAKLQALPERGSPNDTRYLPPTRRLVDYRTKSIEKLAEGLRENSQTKVDEAYALRGEANRALGEINAFTALKEAEKSAKKVERK